MATFPAFLDTCALYGAYLWDSLLCLAEAGTYRPIWSAGVLDELERNLLERGLPKEAVTYRIREMRRSFPDAEVRGYESLVDDMTCDPKDRHVLSAAVRGNAEVLITFNTRDFPEESASAYDITIVHPDDFLLDLLDLYPGDVMSALRTQARGYKYPGWAWKTCSASSPPRASRGSPPRQDDICKTPHGG